MFTQQSSGNSADPAWAGDLLEVQVSVLSWEFRIYVYISWIIFREIEGRRTIFFPAKCSNVWQFKLIPSDKFLCKNLILDIGFSLKRTRISNMFIMQIHHIRLNEPTNFSHRPQQMQWYAPTGSSLLSNFSKSNAWY